MANVLLEGSASVSVRCADESLMADMDFADVGVDALFDAVPWRRFRWYEGQRHYSGTYWAATERALVGYESLLELARLLFADFDPAVTRIVSQPFLLQCRIDGKRRRHIPDFLLLAGGRPLIVDVKPAARAAIPEVSFTFEWCGRLMQSRGFGYEVWSEPDPAPLENIRFLAGYRRDWLFDLDVVRQVFDGVADGVTLAEAFAATPGIAPRLVRAAVLHLLWSGRLVTDLDRPLSGDHVLRRLP